MLTGAQAVVRCLEQERVGIVFGYPGATICPVYDALTSSSVRHVLVREEQNAAHAASGYARISGRPGVCMATSGPGALNLITGIATAYADSIPMVIITGQVSSDQLGRDVFQEADITGAAEPFVKHSYLIKDPSQIMRVMKEAFYIAGTGRPGPVLIDIPVDVQNAEADPSCDPEISIRGYKPTVYGHEGQIKWMIAELRKSKKPLICAGGGVVSSGAQKELHELAELCDLPVVTTMMGLGSIETEHPLNFGMLGMTGGKCANYAVGNADLLILIGARVGDRAVSIPGVLEKRTKIIHIDVDPAEIGKNVEVHVPIVGDVRTVLGQVLEIASPLRHLGWIAELEGMRGKKEYRAENGKIDPGRFIKELSEKAPEDTVFVADVGQNQIWAAGNCILRKGRFLTSGGMGTMGYAIPAAVGAKLASPDRPVIVICGDGSLQMSMMELATICQEKLPIRIIVMKNGQLGLIREIQKKEYKGNYTAVRLEGGPDIGMLAAAYGIPSETVSTPAETGGAIERLLSAEGPFILECDIDPDEPSV